MAGAIETIRGARCRNRVPVSFRAARVASAARARAFASLWHQDCLRRPSLVLSFNAVTRGATVYPSMRRTIVPALLILCSLSLGASAATTAKPTAPPPGIVAEVDGEKITAEQLEKGIAVELSGLQDQIYKLKKQKLDAMIDERLLAREAARQKVSVTELIDREVTAKVSLVTEQ